MRARVVSLLRASVLICGLASGLVGCAASCPVIPGPEREAFLAVKPEEGYVLNPGDQISIEVYQNAQMTRSVTIRPDGQVTLPLVNDVAAAGLSVAQFQARLTERLKSFLRDPVVSISVTSFSEKRIYLQGEVRQAARLYVPRGHVPAPGGGAVGRYDGPGRGAARSSCARRARSSCATPSCSSR